VTGVYQCAAGMNPHLAFTRQQRVYLGETDLTHAQLVQAGAYTRSHFSST
jgi:hypothetical protein